MKKQLDIKKLLCVEPAVYSDGLVCHKLRRSVADGRGRGRFGKNALVLSFFSTLPVALQSFWPSLHPLDLLVGLCCGGGLRLAVYYNMVFTSNRDPAQWQENFSENDSLLCALDRIFDDAIVFAMKGESFRGSDWKPYPCG